MTAAPRPTPLRRSVDTWAELDAFLAERTLDFAFDLDDEVAQSIGRIAVHRSQGRLAMLTEVRAVIREAVEAEAAEQAETAAQESIEARYREAGFDAMQPIEQRLMDGDR